MNLTDCLDGFEDSLYIFSDSRMFLHLLILWAVSIVFCWKVFPLFCSSKEASSDLQMSSLKTHLSEHQHEHDEVSSHFHAHQPQSDDDVSQLPQPEPPQFNHQDEERP